jgi:hypothetical protein
MSDIIEILEEYKKNNSYVSLKRLSKKLNNSYKKTRYLIRTNPNIKRKEVSEVQNSGKNGKWLYYLE